MFRIVICVCVCVFLDLCSVSGQERGKSGGVCLKQFSCLRNGLYLSQNRNHMSLVFASHGNVQIAAEVYALF